jgi:hypothetical protein
LRVRGSAGGFSERLSRASGCAAAIVTRRDQHLTRVEAKLLRHTISRTLTPNSKRPDRRMLPHRAGLPYRHHTADDASAHDKSKNSSSPRCPSRQRNCSKILKTP